MKSNDVTRLRIQWFELITKQQAPCSWWKWLRWNPEMTLVLHDDFFLFCKAFQRDDKLIIMMCVSRSIKVETNRRYYCQWYNISIHYVKSKIITDALLFRLITSTSILSTILESTCPKTESKSTTWSWWCALIIRQNQDELRCSQSYVRSECNTTALYS